MTVRWHPDALAEAAAAARFYRNKRQGLSQRFLNCLEEAIHWVELHTNIYREVEPGIRKCRLKTFPYALIFRTGPDVQIVAVMHPRRQPGYWKERT